MKSSRLHKNRVKRVIYSLRDPITAETRYIGCTSKPLGVRLSHHISTTRAMRLIPSCKLDEKHAWIRRLLRARQHPIITVIDVLPPLSRRQAAGIEAWWIQWFIRSGHALINVSSGWRVPRVGVRA